MPTVLYKDFNTLPDVSAVYVVWRGAECLYVGSTLRLRPRIKGHHKKELFLNTDTIEYFPCDVQWLGTYEAHKIKELLPKFNSYSSRKKIAGPNNMSLSLGKPYSPLGMNEATSFRDHTIYLLNSQHEKSLAKIAKDLNLNYAWLSAFSRGKCINPGVNTVQKLYEYLTDSKLAV